jgi:TonB family protein
VLSWPKVSNGGKLAGARSSSSKWAMRSRLSANPPHLLTKSIILSVAVVLCLNGAFAQTNTDGDVVVKIGDGVSPPAPIYSPDPEYSKEARHAKYQGICVLWMVVGADGRPRDIKVSRTLGLGLDEKAIEAVERWRFKPAMKGGKPVAVRVSVQVKFHLYNNPPEKPNPLPAAEQNEFEIDPPDHFTQEQLAKLAVEWNTKTPYAREQIAELRAKCAPYVDKNFEDLESKRVSLPPHECSVVLGWMRTLQVEKLYVAATPPR